MQIDYSKLPEIPCPICAEVTFDDMIERFDSGRIVRCSNCSHRYLNPTLTQPILDSIYENYHIKKSDERVLEILGGWFDQPDSPYQYAIQRYGSQSNLDQKKVLDIGCGPGLFLNACRKQGADVLGIDPNPHAVRLAKEHFNIRVLPMTIEAAAQNKVLSKDSFDYIFAFEVIEHVTKPGALLKSLWNLAKPGGTVVISTPNFYLFHTMGNSAQVVSNYPEHLHFFEPDTLRSCLDKYGFRVEEIVTKSPIRHGQRTKQVLVKSNFVHQAWRKVRRFKAVQNLKNLFFATLDTKQTRVDEKGWNGLHLMAIASKG